LPNNKSCAERKNLPCALHIYITNDNILTQKGKQKFISIFLVSWSLVVLKALRALPVDLGKGEETWGGKIK
jgi:hypothetical protein